MSLRPTSDLFPLVLTHAPACPKPVAANAIRSAAVEFCERTRCWRVVATVAITEGIHAVTVPAYAAIHEIEMATWDGVPLAPMGYADAIAAWPVPAVAQESLPEVITQPEPNKLMVMPFSTGTLGLSLFLKPNIMPRLGLGPTIDSTEITIDGSLPSLDAGAVMENDLHLLPDFMFGQFGEILAHGALARIFIVPGQPYSDPGLAAFHGAKFDTKTDARFNHNVRGQQRAPRRTRSRFF